MTNVINIYDSIESEREGGCGGGGGGGVKSAFCLRNDVYRGRDRKRMNEWLKQASTRPDEQNPVPDLPSKK